MKKALFILLISSVLVSCKMQQLYLSVLEPAPVTLSREIKKVGVINRSVPTDETKIFDVIDKALSLEGIDLDKDGAEQAIQGLSTELLNNKRFDEIKTLTDIDFRTPSLMGIFPVPLSWDIVDKVCRETGSDALFALEFYDTDTKLRYSTYDEGSKEVLGIKIPGIVHKADMETIVKTGWRIYDPARRIIADEYNHHESVVYSGTGVTPLVAVAGLIGRKDAVKEVSNKAGHGYAFRLIPYQLRVMRDYFVKGTNNFKIARRKAQVGKWNEAGELWAQETTNPKRKVAGRATYNMAIINEINGDLNTSLQWAQKAWEYYRIRPALEYVRILENRMLKTDILNEQQQ
ncbi:MAG: DUF6340 family protein [Bacteroidia bacterium]|nr:DUF6340 family protein [Bacteroidia bacterium]